MGDNDEWKNMFQELTGYEKKNIMTCILRFVIM